MAESTLQPDPLTRPARISLFLLSAATLAFEINLTRLFSVAQFYHFAFMIVSLALLGFGASGALLAILPSLGRKSPQLSVGNLALANGVSVLASYCLINRLPFDSFSIAWDRRQVGILVFHCLALSTPFFFSGLAVSLLLSADPAAAGKTYAINLSGSALGCAIVLAAPSFVGGEGMIMLCCALAALAALICAGRGKPGMVRTAGAAILLMVALVDLCSRLAGRPSFPWLELRLSPYKSLSYALQYPDARVIYRRWNSFSRLDVVRSANIRSLPGLSYRYLKAPPVEDGLLVDGDDLSPVVSAQGDLSFTAFLPASLAYQLRPGASALILEPRGGLDVVVALASGAQRIVAVEDNPLVLQAASQTYLDPRLRTFVESDRSYLRRSKEQFDVLVFSLANSYHPVRSGAYSLMEDYRYTIEAFHDALRRLAPEGLLVVTRWLQTPPSECLRTFALAVTALEREGADPRSQIIAFRGYNAITFLVKRSPFTSAEMRQVRSFTASRAFDLVYAPDIRSDEVNRYNILPEPVYSTAFVALLNAQPRSSFYRLYPFDVSPPTDDRPFFSHYFKWAQAGQLLAEMGKTWQPFGGAGYFVILALLAVLAFLSACLVLLPAALIRHPLLADPAAAARPMRLPPRAWAFLLYFGLIGLAYLFVEIPLIQRFILFLGHPAYAMSAVLFSLLLFSGLGSQVSSRLSLPLALTGLVILLAISPVALSALFDLTLGLPFLARLGLTGFLLAPLGFLMGVPFPSAVSRLAHEPARLSLVPWVWAVNGAVSVIASILAALAALSFGFSWVFRLGSLCYAGASLMAWAWRSRAPAARPDP